MYNSSLLYIHAFASVVGIFVVCTIIDVIRRKLFETPFFRWFDKKTKTIQKGFVKYEVFVMDKKDRKKKGNTLTRCTNV